MSAFCLRRQPRSPWCSCSTPLLTAVFGIALLHERLSWLQWLGLALGMAGVGLVVGHAAFESPSQFQGLLMAFLGVLGLVGGTLYFARFCRGVQLLPGATIQFYPPPSFPVLARGCRVAARRMDARRSHRSGLEHVRRVTRRDGSLFRHACPRHGGAGKC